MAGSNDEQLLRELVLKWTSSMKWRSDWKKWFEGRLRQEDYEAKSVDHIRLVVGDLERKKILDVGSGMGGFSVACMQKGLDIVGVDFNYDYCKIGNLRGNRYNFHMTPVNGVGERLPFKSDQFDLVCLFDVLEHVKNPESVLSEIHRTLKPGGKVYVNVISRFSLKDPHYHLLFINWMPRNLAEWYIRKRKRIKSNSPCQDMQKLSEMHYYTHASFIDFAKRLKFGVRDPSLEKIENPLLIGDESVRKYLSLMKRFRINKLVYRLLAFSRGSFPLMLEKM